MYQARKSPGNIFNLSPRDRLTLTLVITQAQMYHIHPYHVPCLSNSRTSYLLCKGTYEGKADKEEVVPSPEQRFISINICPSSHCILLGRERVQDLPYRGLCLADISVPGRTVCQLGSQSPSLDSQVLLKPIHFLLKLSHQVEELFYLGEPPTDVLAAALRHQ